MTTSLSECNRCGTCCTKGGPALHSEDMQLLDNGVLERGNLITIRSGELVFKPFHDEPQAARCELVKICGIGRDWQCFFYGGEGEGCSIYQTRPLSCRILECWNTTVVEELIEQDTLTRFDIIAEEEPVRRYVHRHNQECHCPDMHALYRGAIKGDFPKAGEFDGLINRDIALRTEAVQTLNISLAEELFYFGRPIFQLLQQLGGRVEEAGGRLTLHWPG